MIEDQWTCRMALYVFQVSRKRELRGHRNEPTNIVYVNNRPIGSASEPFSSLIWTPMCEKARKVKFGRLNFADWIYLRKVWRKIGAIWLLKQKVAPHCALIRARHPFCYLLPLRRDTRCIAGHQCTLESVSKPLKYLEIIELYDAWLYWDCPQSGSTIQPLLVERSAIWTNYLGSIITFNS